MLYENMDQAAIFVYPVERENTTVVYLKTRSNIRNEGGGEMLLHLLESMFVVSLFYTYHALRL
jgi:hypothetical protein